MTTRMCLGIVAAESLRCSIRLPQRDGRSLFAR
jgi:hypothetical protein